MTFCPLLKWVSLALWQRCYKPEFHSLLAIMEKVKFLETRRNKKKKLLWIFTGPYMYSQSSLHHRDYTEMWGEGRWVLIFIFKCVSLSIRGFLIISISLLKWHCWVPCKGYSWIWGFAFLTQSLLAFAKCLALYSYLSLTMMKVSHCLIYERALVVLD